MGVVRGKRSVKIKEKIKAVQIQSTANLFQGVVPANITLKAVPQGFTALNYKWYINAGTSIVGTNQTFIIANNQVETTNVYKVVVTSIDGEDFEATISIAKVRDGSAIVALKRYLDEINVQYSQLTASYNSLYSNPKIGTYQSTLRTAYVDYVAEYNILVNYITAIITQNSFSEAEETVLNGYIANYNLKLVDLVNALETALKLTTDYLDDTIKRINEITSFLDTTVNGNVIGTGVLMVGSANQSNAGISGLNEAGSKSVRLWAGGTAQNRDKARWQMLDDGMEVGYHSNGVLANERGYNGSAWVFNLYNEQGLKTFSLDSARGLVPVPYIPQSFTKYDIVYINYPENVDSNLLRFDLINKFQRVLDFTIPKSEYYIIYLNKDFSIWEYFNGSHPNNANLAQYNGYKAFDNNYTQNCADGWYGFDLKDLGYGKLGEAIFTYNLQYIKQGKIVKNINFTITI